MVVGLFPGSQAQEIKYCLPIMLKSAEELLDQFPNIKFKMAIASKMIEKN